MSNDDQLARRDAPLPVSVRRPLSAVDPALVPPQGTPPAQAAPQIIYINNTPAPAPPVAAPPVPPAVHHHHYTTQNTTHRISYRIPVARSHSALGMASLALGIIACVVCWVPWLGLVAVPVGAIGAVLGVLGVLLSLLFRKSSAGLPLTAIFVCCLAAGISVASTRSLPYWRWHLMKAFSQVMPQGIALPHSTAPAASPAPLPPPGPNLFDLGSNPAAPSPAPAAPSAISPRPGAPKPAIASQIDPSIAAARDQLAAAEKSCDQRTMQTPDYQAAVKTAADARARESLLRQTSPGSADLIQASEDMIKADNAVTDTLTLARASDPMVLAARQTLAAARAAATH